MTLGKLSLTNSVATSAADAVERNGSDAVAGSPSVSGLTSPSEQGPLNSAWGRGKRQNCQSSVFGCVDRMQIPNRSFVVPCMTTGGSWNGTAAQAPSSLVKVLQTSNACSLSCGSMLPPRTLNRIGFDTRRLKELVRHFRLTHSFRSMNCRKQRRSD